MRFLLTALLLAASACFQGNLPEPIPITTKNAKITVSTTMFVSYGRWERSGYFRADRDAVVNLPVMIAIAQDGSACLIDDKIWALWRERDVVACKTSWRFRR